MKNIFTGKDGKFSKAELLSFVSFIAFCLTVVMHFAIVLFTFTDKDPGTISLLMVFAGFILSNKMVEKINK